jgi:hydrogenase expression/formation protein HypE
MAERIELSCPLESEAECVQMTHGGGGRAMARLIDRRIIPAIGGTHSRHDGAELAVGSSRIAFTTDSYVVRPMFFPGGDLGRLAVFGTANDLAMCGARPQWLSLALIAEEGLPLTTLDRILRSIGEAAAEARVEVVTGDTKVVERGHGDGLYINTAGIGVVETASTVGPLAVQPGDAIILNGDLGRHGIAVLSVREGLGFQGELCSDLGLLWPAVQKLIEGGIDIHCLRDLTRGGMSSALNEISSHREAGILIRETAIPVNGAVNGACELLGLDPFYVANEGRFVAFVPPSQAERAAALIGGVIIGEVTTAGPARVVVETAFGGRRVLDMLNGEQLPRIC